MSQILSGLEGVFNIQDDIFVHGRNQAEHDRRLEALFERLSSYNATLNLDKCQFNQSQLSFYRHVFSEKGMSPDPVKV